MIPSWLIAVLGLGVLFALFGVMHLWTGDAPTGGCTGNGDCGDCLDGGSCDDRRREAEVDC